MKKILICCVNYNTYEHLNRFLKSVDNSILFCNNCNLEVSVCIADNSSPKENVDLSVYQNLNIKLYSLTNLGYLGGAFSIINTTENLDQYDYIIISNVDLVLDNTFFETLLTENSSSDVGWIAPTIYSKSEQRDKNPKILNRYSLKRLNILQMMYKYPILHKVYSKTLYKRKKLRKVMTENRMIYAGHGSFIILTKNFFSYYSPITYPIFLFGEEIFFAELMLRKNLKVWYVPSLKIWDVEHSSTSAIKRKSYYQYNYDAISYLKKNFYE